MPCVVLARDPDLRDAVRPLPRRRLAAVLGGAAWLSARHAGAVDPTVDPPGHHGSSVFRNPPGSPRRAGSPAEWRRFLWRQIVARSDPTPPAGHVLPARAVADAALAARDRDSMTWLGHSTFLIRLAGHWLITDPFLTDHASPVAPLGPRRWAPPALRARELPPIDLVLVSHNHYDHLDRPTLDMLPLAPGATLLTPLRVSDYVDRGRFARVVELNWHERCRVGPLQVTALPAIHFSKRTLWDANRSLWAGFLIESPQRRVLFTGDTAFGPVFAELGATYGVVDWALVPIGAYAPRPLMQAAHCDPEEALTIGRAFAARRLAAMHWGAIALTAEPVLEPPERFRAALRAQGLDPAQHAWIPPVGGTTPL